MFFKWQIFGAKPFAHLGDGFVFGTNVHSTTSGAPEIWDVTSDLDAGVNLVSSKNLDDGAYHVAIRAAHCHDRHPCEDGRPRRNSDPPRSNPHISQPTVPLFVGNVFWGELFSATFAFKLAELVVVRRSGSFTVQEAGQLESYLRTKYADQVNASRR